MTKFMINIKNLENLKNYIFFKKTINIFSNQKIYHLHCSHHLGDNVFNFILFYMIKNYIEKNNIKIFYYAKKEYLIQLKEFICSNNIYLFSFENKPNISIELWLNNPLFEYMHTEQPSPIDYNRYYKMFFNKVLNKLKINFTITKLFYKDTDLFERYENIPDKYKEFDILIINSTPLSGQYNYEKDKWDEYIIYLSSHFNILTTTKVSNILCTSDDNLTIKDIASLSIKSKIIIAINSGVVPALLNYDTLLNVKQFYIFDNKCYYSYPNFTNKQNISDIYLSELNTYI